jgi:hypothetical protein
MGIRVQNTLALVETVWEDLEHVAEGSVEERETTCSVDTKKLLRVLHFQAVEPVMIVLCVVESSCLIFQVEIGNEIGHLTYYVPLMTADAL